MHPPTDADKRVDKLTLTDNTSLTLDQQLADARLVLIDDDPMVTGVVEGLLHFEGYPHVQCINDPESAFAKVLTEQPDAILLDWHMPTISGLDLLKQIRGQRGLAAIPILVLTGDTESVTKLEALEAGATDFLAKPIDASELILRLRTCLTNRFLQRQLRYQDTSTGLPNRAHFTRFVDRQLSTESVSSMVVFQVTSQQIIRTHDYLGPQAADGLVMAIASRLKRVLTDLQKDLTEVQWTYLARMDFTNFAVVAQCDADRQPIDHFAEQIVEAVEGGYTIHEHQLFITANVGVCVYPEHGANVNELVANASLATGKAAARGGNQHLVFNSSLSQQVTRHLTLEASLRGAIENRELFLLYQPQINFANQRVTGVEALLRWQSKDHGLISPLDFIPLAEQTGLIVPIGEWVLAQAIEQSRRWATTDLADVVISVNVAAAQFLNVRMRKQLEDAQQRANVDLTKILLEITESTLMVESQSMLNQLHHLRGLGVQFAIDDFGTGYSSLSYLKRLPINQLKIDRSFIKDSPEDEDDNAIIKAIISMAHSLKLEVVAEGVETDLQLRYLNQLQCDQLQGFYFAKPMPVAELEQFCREFHRAASGQSDA